MAAACIVATLYAALLALTSKHLQVTVITLPVLSLVLSVCFWKWKLLHWAGFLSVVPVAVIAFEIARSINQPTINAYEIKALDRSHYVPGARVPVPEFIRSVEGGHGWGVKEIFIGDDGFRADPVSGEGNPPFCRFALIGDSMIYGSGLTYADTLRPVLAETETEACVFGVSGNASVDYLHTLEYVKARIQPGAHVAIYLYVYNDFVSASKYTRRRFGSVALSFGWASDLLQYVDTWRQTTYTYGVFQPARVAVEEKAPTWALEIGSRSLAFSSAEDPATYRPPGPLDEDRRTTVTWFFDSLREIVDNEDWRVSIIFIPDNAEVLASFARRAPVLLDLDARRRDGLRICRESWYSCEDVGPFLYERTLAEGQSPYFVDDRHFSAFGTRLVARHYLGVAARTQKPPQKGEE